jgi:hypothetical protein
MDTGDGVSGAREMEIRLEPEARAYLADRGSAVTLRGSRRHGCCGGTAFVPVAEPGPPADPAGYRTVDADGITVHLEMEMTAGPAPLVIGLDGLWRWRRLRVDGTAIRM